MKKVQSKQTNKQKNNNYFKGLFSFLFSIFLMSILLIFSLSILVSMYFYSLRGGCNCTYTEEDSKSAVVYDYQNSAFYNNNDFIDLDLLDQYKEDGKVEISSPVILSGKANVYEATLYVRILDSVGNAILEDFATADGWMDKKYNFSLEMNYKTSSEKGYIEAFEINPKNGLESNKVIVPVIFN